MNYEWTMNYGEMDVSYSGMSERKTTCELNLEDEELSESCMNAVMARIRPETTYFPRYTTT